MRRPAEHETLSRQVDHVLEELRTVLPGAQALFGFQLIAVFSERFESMTEAQQDIHLAALFAVALAIGLIMTPAMYHRQAEPETVSETFIRIASGCLTAAAVPLLVGIALEFYLVATLIESRFHWNVVLTTVLLATFVGLWFLFPWLKKRRLGGRR
jgi:hypothetical protein